MVSERFELFDEASGLEFGVESGEVVAAGVVVGLAGLEHVPGGGEDGVADGDAGATVAAAGLEASVLGGEVGVVAVGGGERGFQEGGAEPLGAFAGVCGAAFASRFVVAGAEAGPADEMPAVGKTVMSVPISAMITSAVRCLTPGIVQSSRAAVAKGASCSSTASESRSICSSRKSMWARIADTTSACSELKRPSSASCNAGIFCLSLPLARPARTTGSVVPRQSASSIALPETPRMSVATQSSLIPVSSRILCSRLASRWRSPIWA